MSKQPQGILLPKQEFYMYVGLCITAWGKIEEELFDICVDALGCTQERAAIIYYRTPTVRARLDLTDELVSTVLPKHKPGSHTPEDAKIWRALKKKLTDLTEVRRKIAHYPVNHGVAIRRKDTGELIQGSGPVPIDNVVFDNSYWIYMSRAEGLRGRGTEQTQLKTDDLSVHCTELEIIAPKIQRFRAMTLQQHIQEAARQESMRQKARNHPNAVLTIGKPKQPPARREKS
ncbi:hypothetical protein [Bradyrhizobium sp. RDM4]|uniref:hypothetical protein n=1 Tax=Bradyrhizobium sp. RDM4 TaxID=3378765 RepID=UPI0038FD3996